VNFDEIKQRFTNELEKRAMRKTRERYAILEEVYGRNDHFDADELFTSMELKKFPVSRATVYNTLDVLAECGLIRKHRFEGEGGALFEKSLGFRQHGHIICVDCHAIKEFCDPRVHTIQTTVGEALGFQIADHSLVFYGSCRNETCPHRVNSEK
jgi:Fur family transcriptional regulator, ferric uptake regulator